MKEYIKSGNLHPCALKREDLVKLIEIMAEERNPPGAGAKKHFRISVDLPSIHITSESIDGFLEHAELPDKINQLSIWMYQRDDTLEPARAISFTFSEYGVDLNVSGLDQTWVLGKYAQIRDFLREKRPWFWALHKMMQLILAFAIAFSFYLLDKLIRANEIVYSISTAVFLATSIVATVLYLRGKFLPYTQIIVRPKKSFLTRENMILIIAVLSLIVSIIGGVLIPLSK